MHCRRPKLLKHVVHKTYSTVNNKSFWNIILLTAIYTNSSDAVHDALPHTTPQLTDTTLWRADTRDDGPTCATVCAPRGSHAWPPHTLASQHTYTNGHTNPAPAAVCQNCIWVSGKHFVCVHVSIVYLVSYLWTLEDLFKYSQLPIFWNIHCICTKLPRLRWKPGWN